MVQCPGKVTEGNQTQLLRPGRTDRRPIVFGTGGAAVGLAQGLAGESDERQGSCKAAGRRDAGGQAVRVCVCARERVLFRKGSARSRSRCT